jgi:hypothetical protein
MDEIRLLGPDGLAVTEFTDRLLTFVARRTDGGHLF